MCPNCCFAISCCQYVLTTTRLHVIIRPRGGDFCYTDLELERMELDIDAARKAGADGVVFGCLTPDGDVDMVANARLMKRCEGMSVTFHRAFDRARDAEKALDDCIKRLMPCWVFLC